MQKKQNYSWRNVLSSFQVKWNLGKGYCKRILLYPLSFSLKTNQKRISSTECLNKSSEYLAQFKLLWIKIN